MARPRSTTREQLLASVMEYVAEHGIGELSLRPLAEAVGTSHRMLLFHFGSKEQLMVEVVRAVEAQQRQAMAELSARDDLTVMEQMQQSWARLLDPALRNNIRLFYEVYADALRGRGHTGDFLEEVIASWLPPVAAALERAGPRAGGEVVPGTAAADARLMLAVTRGLLLDLVTTGDTAGVDAAMQRFAAIYAGLDRHPAPLASHDARDATCDDSVGDSATADVDQVLHDVIDGHVDPFA